MADLDLIVTLTILEGNNTGKAFELTNPITSLGRLQTDIILDDTKVSSQHAQIQIEEGRVVIKDLRSRNGVWVNGEKVDQHQLKNLDELTIGQTKFRVVVVENLNQFLKRNQPKSEKQGDISSMIEDELQQFSKWDLQDGSGEDISKTDVAVVRLRYEIFVMEGPDQGNVYPLCKHITTIGRASADVVLHDVDISRLHASLETSSDGKIILKDLGSTNGIEVASKKVVQSQINLGDPIRLGSTVLCVRSQPDG